MLKEKGGPGEGREFRKTGNGGGTLTPGWGRGGGTNLGGQGAEESARGSGRRWWKRNTQGWDSGVKYALWGGPGVVQAKAARRWTGREGGRGKLRERWAMGLKEGRLEGLVKQMGGEILNRASS